MRKQNKIVKGLKQAVAFTRKRKLHELDPKKHGVGGATFRFPKPRKEDHRALPLKGYAVVFFPQFDLGWKAGISHHGDLTTFSQTREVAIAKFVDRLGGTESPKQKWNLYHKAGWRVRRVRVVDLGPA